MLQKLQREKIKCQAIEKKTSVADNEVNELTIKNEDLAEQIKSLETQLEETEKKRDAERSSAAKEKDQWGRMLEMSGRLHSKGLADKEKLAEEKAALEQRLVHFEGRTSTQPEEKGSANGDEKEKTNPATVCRHSQMVTLATRPSQANACANDTNEPLKRENTALRERVESLHFALVTVRQELHIFHEPLQQMQAHGKKLEEIVGLALKSDASPSTTSNAPSQSSRKDSEITARLMATRSQNAVAPAKPAISLASMARRASKATLPAGSLHPLPELDLSPKAIAAVSRPRSPDELAELRFEVKPSTQSPEELMRALGPVPRPPSSSFGERVRRSASGSPRGVRRGEKTAGMVKKVSSAPGGGGLVSRVHRIALLRFVLLTVVL